MTGANIEYSCTEDDAELAGGDCSPPVSLLLSNDVLLNGNVPDNVIDEAELLLRRDDGFMPGDFNGMSGHLRGNLSG